MGTRIVQTLIAAAALFIAGRLSAIEPPSGNLLAQATWLKFEIRGGRIAVTSERCNQSQHEAEAAPAEGRRQKLCVAPAAGGLAVHYSEESSRGSWQLHCEPAGPLAIRWLPAEPSAAAQVELVQSANKITLAIGSPAPRTIEAANFWQLLIAERKACEAHLLPLLADLSLLPDLERQSGEVEIALLASAGEGVQSEREAWQQHVAGLARPGFAERQTADQALRAAGQGVLAYLRQLDLSNLTGEQRSRVRSILHDLASGSPDSPQVAAQWLLADKRVWRALMRRGELAQRLAAARHLGHLCGHSIALDPAASDERRAQQLAELSRMLADN